MPAYSTHYIFAKEMMPFLKNTADFKLNEEAVLFGTQGPDIFFFHRVFPWMPGKPLRKIGSLLHRSKPSDILENMMDYCDRVSQNSDIARSYVWGFILHYSLDRRCHPFVYFLQDKITSEKPLTNSHTAHNLIEFSMDSYLLNKRLGVEKPVCFDTASTLSDSDEIASEIGRLYEYIIPRVLGKRVTQKDVKTALRDTKTIQKTTHDERGIKRFLISILDIIIAPFSKNYKFSAMLRPRDLNIAKKYGNIDNKKWVSPFDGSIHFESFENLFELSKNDAEVIIKKFQNGDDMKKATGNKSFLTGVEVK